MNVVDVLAVLLVIMAVLPVLAAVVLWRFRHSESTVLRERAQLSLLLAGLAIITAVLALNRLLGWGFSGPVVSIPFAVLLLLLDLASGRWLWQFWFGDFGEPRDWPETPIELEDRTVGDERRRLQAKAAEEEDG